jgi:hypothetical protein
LKTVPSAYAFKEANFSIPAIASASKPIFPSRYAEYLLDDPEPDSF